MTEERKTHKTDPDAVKVDHLMAIIHYVKVKEISGRFATEMKVVPVDDQSNTITVSGRSLITDAFSADYFAEEIKTTMTDVAEKLTTSYNRPLTVCFTKQPGKDETSGGERILRGRFLSHEALLGRSYVEDMDKPVGDRIRLVDHRTLKWLIVDGVKYTVKGKK